MGFFSKVKKLWSSPEQRAEQAIKEYLGDEYTEKETPTPDATAEVAPEPAPQPVSEPEAVVTEKPETAPAQPDTPVAEPEPVAEMKSVAEAESEQTAEQPEEPVSIVEEEAETVSEQKISVKEAEQPAEADMEPEIQAVSESPETHEEIKTEEKESEPSIPAPRPAASAGTTILEPVMPGAAETEQDAEKPQWQRDLTKSLQQAEPRLSVWLNLILEGIDEACDDLWDRLEFLLIALEAPKAEATDFISRFKDWLEEMDYEYVEEFRSELQYRLALALELEDEEDERSRLFIKLSEGLNKTREQITKRIDSMLSSHTAFDDDFWEEFEEILIMADVGYEATVELVERMKDRVRKAGETNPENFKDLLREELDEIFKVPKRIKAYNPPEVVMMIGVNGVGKTTTIAKLAHRAQMQGRKVLIVAGDTFRAAAIGQLEVWARRVGAGFYAKEEGSDPAAVAYEAIDYAVKNGYDLMLLDTAGRLHTKTNLMEELHKIRRVLGKKHDEAPHRSVLVIDATTGQNALSQTKLFNEAIGVDELILTKLDGTAKGGVMIAVTMQNKLPITYVGLGEKMEDLRPFNGEDFAKALLLS
ncbi:signal recognition particle-docking protein FtsY [Maridesulfovibrio sp.]|uniref:signal recognition particle-docking protein FtsY n=1 Tax=Maridesulfovibrio sp. TaxID=2795000 RepID=UPI002A186ADA|nr:signal recognition particle-docking protein FtsY [Maridesulfovibrio sp.]